MLMDVGEQILIPAQRRERLMRLLRQEEVLSVKQLTELLGVSHMTVRRDIEALVDEGRADSLPGGVRLPPTLRQEPPFAQKQSQEPAEKAAIAELAEPMLHDGMTIYLDAGSTTAALVPSICAHADMTVITNDFLITAALIEAGNVETLHIGGRVEVANRSTVGALAAQMASALNSDVAFVSSSSWDLSRGVTTPSEPKVAPKRAAIEASSKAVLLVTSSKYGRAGLYTVAPLSRFDRIITDERLPAAAARGIRSAGIALELATPRGLA